MCFDEDGLVNNSWVLQIKMVVQNVWKWTEKMSKFFATPTLMRNTVMRIVSQRRKKL